jgi:thiol-disulfide isomerase/thioredoxin
MKRNILLVGIIAILSAVTGLYAGNRHLQAEAETQSASAALFALSLPDLKGQNQPLAQWKGQALLVNFWATWCTPCVQEMPELSALQSSHQLKDTKIIGIGIDSAENIAQFVNKYKISYPLYVAGMNGSTLLRQMGDPAGGLPFSVLLTAGGQVKKVYLGRLNMDDVKRDAAAP